MNPTKKQLEKALELACKRPCLCVYCNAKTYGCGFDCANILKSYFINKAKEK